MSQQEDDNDSGFETENETREPGPDDDELGIAPDRPEAFPTERET
jgi:hypothetical protein